MLWQHVDSEQSVKLLARSWLGVGRQICIALCSKSQCVTEMHLCQQWSAYLVPTAELCARLTRLIDSRHSEVACVTSTSILGVQTLLILHKDSNEIQGDQDVLLRMPHALVEAAMLAV